MDKEQVKKTITEKLPEVLPKAVKWVINHIIMFIFHFHMPIWVTAVKAGKSVKTFKNGKSEAVSRSDGETSSASTISKRVSSEKLFAREKITLASRTILHHYRVISTILQSAVYNEVIVNNPCRASKHRKSKLWRLIILMKNRRKCC